MQIVVLIAFLLLFSVYLLFVNYQHNKESKISIKVGDGIGTCMFCGSKNLSKEHVFPDWLKTVIPRNTSKHGFESLSYGIDKKGKESVGALSTTYKGYAGSKKLRIVCHNCNNGWMSGVQNNNKLTLTKLIKNENIILDTKSQRNLAAWCTMMTMVGERVYEAPYVITVKDRATFYKNHLPLTHWHIWIAKNSSKRRLNLMRLALSYTYEGEAQIHSLNSLIESGAYPSSLILSYAVENYIFFALYDIRNKPIKLEREFDSKLTLIHPQTKKQVDWSSLIPIDDNDLKNLNAFFWSLS